MKQQSEMKKIWDNHEIIGEVQKSNATKLVVTLATREGVKYINIREWYKKQSDNIWRPGSAGIILPVSATVAGQEVECAIEFLNLVDIATNLSKDFALADDEKAVWVTKK